MTTSWKSTPRVLAFNDLERAYDDPERVGRLAGLVEDLRDERTAVCGAGDDTALGPVALLSGEGRGLARPFFEAVGPDAETFGNHDLDPGRRWALEWADAVPPTYCCANVDGPGTASIPDATRLELGGRRIGIVGVTHPTTADVCASVSELTFHDPLDAVERELRRLRGDGADAVVVLSHCGGRDREIAAGTDADAVVGGHVHRRVCERVDGTAFVRTAGGGTELAEVTLGEQPEAVVHDATDGPLDEHVAATYRERRDDTGADKPVAEIDEPVTRTDADRFEGESRVGNFLADALRREADADLALFPAGSIRTGPPLSGTVTVGDVVSLAPFDDAVREVAVSGDALRRALDGAAVPLAGERGWAHAHVSGASVRWNADGGLHRATVGGEPLADERPYSVATTGWLVEVDESFDPIAPDEVVADHAAVYEAALAHARNGGLAATERDGRIRKLE